MTLNASPRITVIVCTRDRPKLLEQCLAALSAQTHPCFDVLVVDNSPAHPVRDICDRWGAAWVPCALPGVARARNHGAYAASGELIAYIDDDAVAESGWLEELVRPFEDPAVAGVSGRIRYMKAVGDSRVMSGDEAAETIARPRQDFGPHTPNWFSLACFGGISDGGNMAFRRQLIAELQPFDERIGRGRTIDSGEEHVLFASLISSGFQIVHQPHAVWRHPSPSTPELLRGRRLSDLKSSFSYLMFLWSEYPRHRFEIVGFLARAIAKRMTLSWITRTCGTWSQSLMAIAGGLLAYKRARLEWVRSQSSANEESANLMTGLIEPTQNLR